MAFSTSNGNVQASEFSLEENKFRLETEVRRYGLILEELEAKVKNHEAQGKEYADLCSDIEAKTKEVESLTSKIESLKVEKGQAEVLHKEIVALKEESTKAKEEGTHLMSIVRVLQQEIADFRSVKEEDLKVYTSKIEQIKKDMEGMRLLRLKHAKDMQTFADRLRTEDIKGEVKI